MTTLLIEDPVFLGHVTPIGHPECDARLLAISEALRLPRFHPLRRHGAVLGDASLALLAHPEAYVDSLLRAVPGEGVVYLDPDTPMSPGTIAAAFATLGSAVFALDEVLAGRASNAFIAARPPGHHAERATAMGFCFFNTAAIVARHAAKAHGLKRIAILDWDVHHGNGTQDIFWSDPDVLFVSSHEMPLYPGTGAASERGEHGTIVNVPLRAGDGGEAFRAAYETRVVPRIAAHAPELIVISAGFDAHAEDPLANLRLEAPDFAWVTARVMELAARHAGGRIVSLLEGGYALSALAASVEAHVETLMSA